MSKASKAKALWEKKLAALSAEDRSEVSRFGQYLEDSTKLSKLELLNKHGEYMGFSAGEIETLREQLNVEDFVDDGT